MPPYYGSAPATIMNISTPSSADEIEKLYCRRESALKQESEHSHDECGIVSNTSPSERTLHGSASQNDARSDNSSRKREVMGEPSALAIKNTNASEENVGETTSCHTSASRQARGETVATPNNPPRFEVYAPDHIPSPASTVRAEYETESDQGKKPYITDQAISIGYEHLTIPQFPSADHMPQELEAIESIFWSKDLAVSSMLPPWWWWSSVPPTWQSYQTRYTEMARHIAFCSSKSPSQVWADPAMVMSVDFLIAAYRNRTHELQTLFMNYSTVSNPYVLNAALLLASRTNCIEAVNTLLSFGASPSGQDVNGITALHVAAERNFPQLLLLLLGVGSNVNCKTKSGDTPWSLISGSSQHDKVAKLLISAGAQRDVCVHDGTSISRHAIRGCDIKYSFHNVISNVRGEYTFDTVRTMLERGMDPNIRTCRGRYPLDIAVSGVYIDLVKLLVESGADVNCGLEWGRTPLNTAYEVWQIDMPKIRQFLLEHGAVLGQNAGDDQMSESSFDSS